MTPPPGPRTAAGADTWEQLQSTLRTFARNRDWSDEAWAPVQAALEARDAFHRAAIEHEAWDEGYAAAAARAEARAGLDVAVLKRAALRAGLGWFDGAMDGLTLEVLADEYGRIAAAYGGRGAFCDRVVNDGMGEPTECGRMLPCEYHDGGRDEGLLRLLRVFYEAWDRQQTVVKTEDVDAARAALRQQREGQRG